MPAGGFTIIELTIVLAILAPVLGIVLSGLSTVVVTSVDATVQVEAQTRVIFTTKKLRKDLTRAQIESITPDGLSITFKHPLDLTGTGSLVDPAGNVQWGAVEATGPDVASSYTFSFVQDATVQEATLQKDLNGDGDMTDTFQLGHLQRSTTLGQAQSISASVYMVDAANPTGDLDGDGLPDPLFSWNIGDPVTINLLTRIPRRDSRLGSSFNRTRIFLSNMTE